MSIWKSYRNIFFFYCGNVEKMSLNGVYCASGFLKLLIMMLVAFSEIKTSSERIHPFPEPSSAYFRKP